MLPGNAALAPERTYRPGSADLVLTVSFPDIDVYDYDVTAVVEWDNDGDWSVETLYLPNGRAVGRGPAWRNMPGTGPIWPHFYDALWQAVDAKSDHIDSFVGDVLLDEAAA